MQYHLKVDSQLSNNILVASEKMTVGGLSSVRGFKQHAQSGESAIVLRNELVGFTPSFDLLPMQRVFGNFNFFTAFDFGYFCAYEDEGAKHDAMSGIAAGIKNRDGALRFNFTIARPIETPATYRHKNTYHFSVFIDL